MDTRRYFDNKERQFEDKQVAEYETDAALGRLLPGEITSSPSKAARRRYSHTQRSTININLFFSTELDTIQPSDEKNSPNTPAGQSEHQLAFAGIPKPAR